MTGFIFFAKRFFLFWWDLAVRIATYLWTHPRVFVITLAVLLLLVIGLQMKGCFKAKPKFNEAEIQKAQQAIADQDRKAMVEVLAASEVREKTVDTNVATGKTEMINAYADARKKYDDMTPDELQAEINEKLK